MRKCLLAALLGLLAAAQAVAAGVPTLPFRDVKPGMLGNGKTVFDGTRVETFAVEIVGTLPNVGPDQDLILGRLSGGPLLDTGVLAGMSGSPVYVDGKLIGAVAYSWGFAKEPIAGITPIGEMLALTERSPGPPSTAAGLVPADLARLYRPSGMATFLSDGLRRRLPAHAGSSPLRLPLAVGGLGVRGFAHAAPALADAGFLPQQGLRGLRGLPGPQSAPAPGEAGDPAPPLAPGAAVGLKLTRGDVDLTATGTVTWVDGDRVLAFGHPLFGLGDVDLPLTAARVELLLASLEQSSRLATPLKELGAVRQDRAAGILGRLGASPSMIPVRLQLAGGPGEPRSYSFDVADDPLLAPLLLYASLNGILAGRERAFGSATLRVGDGSVIKLAGQEDVQLDNVYAGPTAFEYSTGITAYILYLLMNNDWRPPEIAGVNLLFEYAPAPETAQIRRATLDRYHARPGETVRLSVVLAPFRGPRRVVTHDIVVPPETDGGPLILHVGGAAGVARVEGEGEPLVPRGLRELIRLINSLRRNDRVYVTAYAPDTGSVLGGFRLPGLPPSAGALLARPAAPTVPRRLRLEEAIPTDHAVRGLARLRLMVEVP